jgi:hypothetical protein
MLEWMNVRGAGQSITVTSDMISKDCSTTSELEMLPDLSVDPCFAEINGSPRVQPMSLRLVMRHLPFMVVDPRLMPRDSIRAGDRLTFCGARFVTRSSYTTRGTGRCG